MGNVTLENLIKRYEDVTAVDDVSLDVRDGEFVTLVGPSGCGKSTTLEMIAGLTKPTSGTVTIAGREVTDLPPKDRGIAMVFQNIALFPHMDVHDNISFGLRLRDFDDDEIDRRVERAAGTVQMEGMLDRMPDELSGGQRQRVAIARAIVRDPEVFLMDEPLANLDAALRVHMRTELQRLHKELDATIVYVTHDQEEAMTMSNRLAVMNEGKVQQFARPLECYNQPANAFVAGFIGSPSMNFFDGEIDADGVRTGSFHVGFDPARFDLSPGREVTLGIRPEDLALPDGTDGLTDPTDPFPATVDVVEPVGDEVFVYFVLEGDGPEDELLVSAPPDPDLTEEMAGTSHDLRLDRACVHLFDAETGEAILHGLDGDADRGEATGPGDAAGATGSAGIEGTRETEPN
ncbi:ABC transporter ATP-binding protein [Halorarum salinum]|uniref:ABC-type D-xylose/L-arabinose transporter n=1 Tax=Halorarum salinum TaxID=2743089 RepID=A0A7D5LAF8_9EURY|nr:ABC transporter ATP-binding protein [Halobaculum salinum]QLG61449.1 ABC transporter ATP-binding protein [Halobaculum salinum]